MKRNQSKFWFLVLLVMVVFVVATGSTGCKKVYMTQQDDPDNSNGMLVLTSKPTELSLSKADYTTIDLNILDYGKDYYVQFKAPDGGKLSETAVYLYSQSNCTVKYYPAKLDEGVKRREDVVRAVVKNMGTDTTYSEEVTITVKE